MYIRTLGRSSTVKPEDPIHVSNNQMKFDEASTEIFHLKNVIISKHMAKVSKAPIKKLQETCLPNPSEALKETNYFESTLNSSRIRDIKIRSKTKERIKEKIKNEQIIAAMTIKLPKEVSEEKSKAPKQRRPNSLYFSVAGTTLQAQPKEQQFESLRSTYSERKSEKVLDMSKFRQTFNENMRQSTRSSLEYFRDFSEENFQKEMTRKLAENMENEAFQNCRRSVSSKFSRTRFQTPQLKEKKMNHEIKAENINPWIVQLEIEEEFNF